MARSLPPLNWFRAFDAAARQMSFTAAAEELGMTQSAVSQHIAALESRLGSKLFIRKPRGLALTDAGRLLVPEVAEALDTLRRATDAFAPAGSQDVITIATSASIARWYLVPNLPDLQRRHPGISLRIVTTVWPDEFSSTEADIEIRFGTVEVAGKGATELDDGRLLAVTALGDIPALDQAPLIQTVGISQNWEQVLARIEGQKPRRSTHFADTHGLAVDMAVAGAGVALTSALIARPALDDNLLQQADIGDVFAKERYFLSVNGDADAGTLAVVVSWLRNLLRL